MKKYQKILALALSAAMALSMAACGEKEPENGTQTVTKEFTYVPEYIDISGEDGTMPDFYRTQLKGDSICYLQHHYDEERGTSQQSLCEYSLTEKKLVKEIPLTNEEEGNRNINQYHINEDGSFYTLEMVYSEDYSSNSTLICSYDAQGSRTKEQDITSVISDGSEGDYVRSYVDDMMVDGEGRIYLISQDTIRLLDKDANYQGEIKADEWINSIGIGKDGKVYCSYYDSSSGNGGYCLAEVDFAGKKMGAVYKNYPGNGNGDIVVGIDKDFLVASSSSVYEYDMASQSYEVLFDWLDSDINGTYVDSINVTEDGRLIALIRDWNTNEQSVAVMTKTKTADLPVKTPVTIGTLGMNQDLQAAAVEFNKQSSTYRVTIKNYVDETNWTEDTYNNAITNLNNDIVSGTNCPDLIDLSSVNVEELAAKGVFEDLGAYLDQSSVLGREDYLDNILESYTYDGVLAGIPSSFYVETVVGKTADVGTEIGWTLDDIIAYSEEHPDTALFDGATKSTLMYYLLAYNQDQFIDYGTGTCKFDSEEFKKLLTFVERFPDEYDWQSDDRSTPAKLQAGDVLLETVFIDDFEAVQPYEAMFGEPVTFIGFPTMDGGSGCMLSTQGAYGISTKAQNKEGAWAFIEYYLSRESDNNMFSWGFPTRKSAMEEKIEDVLTVEYLKDENGELILDEEGNPIPEGGTSGIGYGDWEYTYHPVTEEEVEITKQLIESARPAANTNSEIMTIITEETEAFFKGQKSVDDVVGVIQSRVQLYINENQ